MFLNISLNTYLCSKIIEWFIENQAFSPSYDLAPPPPPPPPLLPSLSSIGERQTDWDHLLGGVGCGGGAKSYDGEKPDFL